MERAIVSFLVDDAGEWVATLSCGHLRHVRHRPPFEVRPWVTDPEGRDARLGTVFDCPLCDRAELPDDVEVVRASHTWDEHTMPAGPSGPARFAIDFLDVGAPSAERPHGGDDVAGDADEGGDPACWAGLVCPECGAVVGPSPHRPGCREPALGDG